ncbi:hypothetical protein Y049_205 [Burkholderia pseudomallei MSHR684]|nr:hypothetical protein Y049_205 [Burkholderia pseudomallei MSHR684]
MPAVQQHQRLAAGGRIEAPGSGARARQHGRGALRRRRPHVAHDCASRTALAQHEFNRTFHIGHERLVPTMQRVVEKLLYPLNPLDLQHARQRNQHFEQIDGSRRPTGTLRLLNRERPLMVRVEPARIHALFIHVFIRNADHQIPPGLHDTHPAMQRFDRVTHVLQAMRGMQEIERVVAHAGEQLRIAVCQVPLAHGTHGRELSPIAAKSVRTCADVDAVADEIPTREIPVTVATLGRLALFVHTYHPPFFAVSARSGKREANALPAVLPKSPARSQVRRRGLRQRSLIARLIPRTIGRRI